MRVRGVFLVLLVLLSASFVLATTDAGPYTAAPGGVHTVETTAAGVYTVEFDLTASQLRGDRMVVLATFFGKSSNELIGQLGILTNGKAIMIGRQVYGSGDPSSYPEGPRPRWGLGNGQTAHIKVTIDAGANTIRYEIEGLSPYQTSLGSGTASIASQGLKVEFGFKRDAVQTEDPKIHEAVPTGWVYRNMVVTGGGESSGGDPGAGEPAPLEEIGTHGSFTSTQATPYVEFNIGGAGPYNIVDIEYDVTAGPTRTDQNCGPQTQRCELAFFGLFRPDMPGNGGGYLGGTAALDEGNGPTKVIFFGRDAIAEGYQSYNAPRENFRFTQGQTYHVHVNIDTNTGTAVTEISGNGQSATVPNVVPYDANILSNMKVHLGNTEEGADSPTVAPYGWTVSNFVARASAGASYAGGGATPQSIVLAEDPGPFTTGPTAPVKSFEVPAAAKYTIEVDVTPGPGPWRTDVSPVGGAGVNYALIDANGHTARHPSDSGIAGMSALDDAGSRALYYYRSVYGTCPSDACPLSYKEAGQRFEWVPGTTYHLKLVIDTANRKETATIDDGSGFLKEANLPETVAHAASAGLTVSFGGAGADWDNEREARTHGWTFTNMKITGDSGEGGDLGGTVLPGSWREYTQDSSGFEPETTDPEPFSLFNETSWTFTPQDCGGALIWCPTSVYVTNVSNNQSLEKLIVNFDMEINDVLPASSFTPTLWVKRACSDKMFAYLDIRMPPEGTVILYGRGLTHIATGQLAFAPGTYHVEYVYDLADEETYAVVSQGGTPVLTVGGRINNDATNPITMDQLAGDLTIGFSWYRDYPGQLFFRPTGFTFSGLRIEGVQAGASYNQTGPDGADFGSDDGRLAFLAATLADAAAQEDSRAVLDCGPATEVLITPPGEEPADAGDRYCALVIGDEDVAFGTFGVGSQGGNSTIESAVLETYQDTQYALQLEESDIDPHACDSIDTTRAEFQECPDAVDGMRTYAYYHTQTGTVFLIVSRSAIDAFDTTIIERIGGFFRSLFGFEESTTGPTSAVPLRRFHHMFLLSDVDRTVMATWFEREASLSYRGFVTVLNETVPEDGTYLIGDQTQLISIPLDADKSADVDRWRRMTAALRIGEVPGEPFAGDTCGNGIVGIAEQCEEDSVCSALDSRWDENTTLPCTTCRYDFTACMPAGAATNGSCNDPWIPVEYPQPCGESYFFESTDEAACPTSRPGSGGGGGGSNNPCAEVICSANQTCDMSTGSCVGTVNVTNPCPTAWTKVAEQGVYTFEVSEQSGHAAIRVKSTSSFDTCVDNDVDLNVNFGPHTASTPQVTVYNRHKNDYNLRVFLTVEGSDWVFDGDPSVDTSGRGISEADAACWHCSASYMHESCSGLDLKIPICTPVNASATGSPGSTPGACTIAGRVCASSTACCSGICTNSVCEAVGGANPPPGYGGSGCFIAGTPVLTPDGAVPIETLLAGDSVRSFDPVTGTASTSTIEYVTVRDVTALVVLTLADREIVTTPEHPFWTANGWIVAGDLSIGDSLRGEDGTWIPITQVETRTVAPTPVYNLHVAQEPHDYYAGGVLVHNKMPAYDAGSGGDSSDGRGPLNAANEPMW